MNKYKLINPTLNVSLFFTGKYKYFFNLHRACKLGQYQWNRAWISQYKTTARVVFDEEQIFCMLDTCHRQAWKAAIRKIEIAETKILKIIVGKLSVHE